MNPKVTLNIPADLLDWAKAHAVSIGTTTTEVFRLALHTLRFIKQAESRGEKILLEMPDGRLRQIVWR